MKKTYPFLTLLLTMILLISLNCKKVNSCLNCNDTNNPNKPPTASAGADQSIYLPTDSAILDGSASTDPEGLINEWFWQKISGPSSYTINSATSAKVTVKNLTPGIYQFELHVVDAGRLVDKDTMQVTVNLQPDTSSLGIDVYVAGSGSDGGPKYWKNGREVLLPFAIFGLAATSIAVVDSNIYLAGTRFELVYTDYRATSWKNGQEVPLTNGAAGATSIAATGSDVYVTGYEYNGNIAVAKYWKNGQSVVLSSGITSSYANSIAIAGSDIYVAGNSDVGLWNSIAKYWKNGQEVPLTNGSNYAVANSIAIAGSDIYITGDEEGIAKYWKNGHAVYLSQGVATSIAVVGSDVYVAGYTHRGQGNSVAKYWKNGQEIPLTNGSEAFATSIAIVDGDVYVAGFEYNSNRKLVAKYWKNGQEVILTNGASAHSIVVVKH